MHLTDNQIGCIDVLGNIPNLRILDLSGNQVDDISPLFELGQLEYVNLYNYNERKCKHLKKMEELEFRETTLNDLNDILTVEKRAFGYDKEAKLTAELLSDKTAEPVLSLLAIRERKAIGHILFTRVYINKMTAKQPLIHILAPLAVIPEYQKQGIGGMLIQEGLKKLKSMGTEMVFVLGHIEYYPKYGFIPDAGKLGYAAPFPIPEEYVNAWMLQPLNNNGLIIEKGNVICCNALNKPEHWRE